MALVDGRNSSCKGFWDMQFLDIQTPLCGKKPKKGVEENIETNHLHLFPIATVTISNVLNGLKHFTTLNSKHKQRATFLLKALQENVLISFLCQYLGTTHLPWLVATALERLCLLSQYHLRLNFQIILLYGFITLGPSDNKG